MITHNLFQTKPECHTDIRKKALGIFQGDKWIWDKFFVVITGFLCRRPFATVREPWEVDAALKAPAKGWS